MTKYEWKTHSKHLALTTFDSGLGKVQFKDILQLIIQKSDYTRLKIYNNDGGSSRVEDEVQVPAFGPSSVPFDVQMFISKESAGDSDIFIMSYLVKTG